MSEGLDPDRVYDVLMDVARREEQEQVPELYYGPPDKDHYCAYDYYASGRTAVAGTPRRRCPNHIDFYVKLPDGRGPDWRKARAACCEHLTHVIWQMQDDYAADGESYTGEYLLRAAIL